MTTVLVIDGTSKMDAREEETASGTRVLVQFKTRICIIDFGATTTTSVRCTGPCVKHTLTAHRLQTGWVWLVGRDNSHNINFPFTCECTGAC